MLKQLTGGRDGDITPVSSVPGTPAGPYGSARLKDLGPDGLPISISGRMSRASNGDSVSDRPTVGVTTLVDDDSSDAYVSISLTIIGTINNALVASSIQPFKLPVKFLDTEEELFELPQKVSAPCIFDKLVN